MDYIFGFGSLIEQVSRTRTTPAAIYVLPAKVKGFTRGWWARTGALGFSPTFLGAVAETSGSMNGVVYAASEEELARTDKREAGYTRMDVTNSIEILGGAFKPKGKVWIYANKPEDRQTNLPSPDFPIVQSYIILCSFDMRTERCTIIINLFEISY